MAVSMTPLIPNFLRQNGIFKAPKTSENISLAKAEDIDGGDPEGMAQ